MDEPVVRARALGKCYRLHARPLDRLRETFSPTRTTYSRPFWALEGLDLEIQRGETVGLLGANGAGKSTTLKLLAKKLKPSAGSVEVRGSVSSILELGTGFQGHLTGRQNAEVSALLLGHPPWAIDAFVEKILAFAEIGEHADQPLSTYSSGMQSRLAFSTLTTLEPEVLILDEALATGDARFAQKCNDYLRKLCRSGCTTIVASHDVRFLVTTCDRLVLLERGKKTAEGSPATVAQRYLDSLGHVSEAITGRPRQVLLRLEWPQGVAPPEAPAVIHALEWLADGRAVGEHYIGDDAIWQGLLDAAGAFGFSPDAARRSWRPAVLIERSLSRGVSPPSPGAAFLTLPVPPPPWPIPEQLRVRLRAAAPPHLVASLQIAGRFHELGALGRADATGDWVDVTFDVGAALGAEPRQPAGSPA